MFRTSFVRVLSLVGTAVFFPILLFAAGPPPSGTISGLVRRADSNAPARFASVRAISTVFDGSGNGHIAFGTTRFDGTFSITNVPPGDYVMDAALAGYVGPQKGRELSEVVAAVAKSDKSNLIHVESGKNSATSVSMVRGAVLTGKVTYQEGAPAPGLLIEALQIEPSTTTSAHVMPAYTDDGGAYRIAGIPPGKWIIKVSLPEGRAGTLFYPTYFGDTFYSAKAKVLVVQEPRLLSGLDIKLQTAGLHHVAGVLKTHSPQSAAFTVVKLTPKASGLPVLTTLTEADGSFDFPLIPAGTFTLSSVGITQEPPLLVTTGKKEENALVLVQ